MAVHHAVGISRQRNSGYRPSRVNIVAQGLSTPDPSLSPTHISIRKGRATTTHYTHYQVSLVVSRNTTLVPSLGLRIGPACEAGLSAGMRRERVSPQIRKKERKTYAVSAWIGFTPAAERERIEAFIRRCKRSELCSAETKTFAEICEVYDSHYSATSYVIHVCIPNQLLPSVSAAAENYNLRPLKHNRLTTRLSMLILFTDIFIVTFINDYAVTTTFTILLLRLRSGQPFIKPPLATARAA